MCLFGFALRPKSGPLKAQPACLLPRFPPPAARNRSIADTCLNLSVWKVSCRGCSMSLCQHSKVQIHYLSHMCTSAYDIQSSLAETPARKAFFSRRDVQTPSAPMKIGHIAQAFKHTKGERLNERKEVPDNLISTRGHDLTWNFAKPNLPSQTLPSEVCEPLLRVQNRMWTRLADRNQGRPNELLRMDLSALL